MGLILLDIYKPAETHEALALLAKAGKIMRRVVPSDDPYLRELVQALKEAQVTLARFDECGVLSAMPCYWRATSRQEDGVMMTEVFAHLLHTAGSSSASISSEVMQEGLRLHGLFNFTASSSDLVRRSAALGARGILMPPRATCCRAPAGSKDSAS